MRESNLPTVHLKEDTHASSRVPRLAGPALPATPLAEAAAMKNPLSPGCACKPECVPLDPPGNPTARA